MVNTSIIMVVLCGSVAASNFNLTVCPDNSQWSFRAASLCNRMNPAFVCLFDDNEKIYKEFCWKEPESQTPGFKFVIRGGLDSKQCEQSRYQPFKLTTYGHSKCMFAKTLCTEEGQIQYDNGTTTSNRLCRCDYRNSYTFITRTRKPCYCEPTEEDCSCYKKVCPDGQVLSPDFVCVQLKRVSWNSNCPEIKRFEMHNEKQDEDYNEVTTRSFKDVYGIIQDSSARIVITAVACVAIIVGFLNVVLYNLNEKSQDHEDHLDNLKKEMQINHQEAERNKCIQQQLLKEAERNKQQIFEEAEHNKCIQQQTFEEAERNKCLQQQLLKEAEHNKCIQQQLLQEAERNKCIQQQLLEDKEKEYWHNLKVDLARLK